MSPLRHVVGVGIGAATFAGCLWTTDLTNLDDGTPNSGGADSGDGGIDAKTTTDAIADVAAEDVAEGSVTTDILGCNAGFDAGLVGFWQIEETSGDAILDCSGNGFHGFLTGGAGSTTRVEGRKPSTHALQFNGGFIQLPNSPLVAFSKSFSVAMWVNSEPGTNSGFIGRGNAANKRGFSVEMEGDNSLSLYLSAPDGGDLSLTTVANGPISTWFHLVAVYSAGNTRIYVNGILTAGKSDGFQDLELTPDAIQIGRGWFDCCSAKARMDEIRLFARALSEAEVATLAKE